MDRAENLVLFCLLEDVPRVRGLERRCDEDHPLTLAASGRRVQVLMPVLHGRRIKHHRIGDLPPYHCRRVLPIMRAGLPVEVSFVQAEGELVRVRLFARGADVAKAHAIARARRERKRRDMIEATQREPEPSRIPAAGRDLRDAAKRGAGAAADALLAGVVVACKAAAGYWRWITRWTNR